MITPRKNINDATRFRTGPKNLRISNIYENDIEAPNHQDTNLNLVATDESNFMNTINSDIFDDQQDPEKPAKISQMKNRKVTGL